MVSFVLYEDRNDLHGTGNDFYRTFIQRAASFAASARSDRPDCSWFKGDVARQRGDGAPEGFARSVAEGD